MSSETFGDLPEVAMTDVQFLSEEGSTQTTSETQDVQAEDTVIEMNTTETDEQEQVEQQEQASQVTTDGGEANQQERDIPPEAIAAAVRAGITFGELTTLSDAAISALANQTPQVQQEIPPQGEEVNTQGVADTQPPEDFTLELDPELFDEDLVKGLGPVQEVIRTQNKQIAELSRELQSIRQHQAASVSAERDKQVDGMFNSLSHDAFGQGTINSGLTPRQQQARIAVFHEMDGQMQRGLPMEAAFEMAVKRHFPNIGDGGNSADSQKGKLDGRARDRTGRLLPTGASSASARTHPTPVTQEQQIEAGVAAMDAAAKALGLDII